MNSPNPIREFKKQNLFKSGDTLVVFGEVFERGYVNGLIDEAKKHGLKIVYTTVGRRDENQKLRKLTAEEIIEKNQTPIINIPLEAGFDLEPDHNGVRPVDHLKEYGLTGWESAQLDWASLEESRLKGVERFRGHVADFLAELEKQIDPSQNIIFAHTMAGGFPRAKVVMPIANRVFKGTGARYQSSQVFWESQIGQLCALSFREVTGETLFHLIEVSSQLRKKIENSGGQVRYLAYGYHGNEILIGEKYEWYSYSPYLQGFAKLRLEEVASQAAALGATATVFNVPEILTNSSSLFLGIEVVIYPLLRALQKENPKSERVKTLLTKCQSQLKELHSFADIEKVTEEYLNDKAVRAWPNLKGWPQHNQLQQMEAMIKASNAIIQMHKNQKELMTAELSEIVFRSSGKIMLNEIASPRGPILWIGHDAIAKVFDT